MATLHFGSVPIDYELSFKDRKSLTIKVYPDGSVRVSAPMGSALEKIETKLRKKPLDSETTTGVSFVSPADPAPAVRERGNTSIPGPSIPAPDPCLGRKYGFHEQWVYSRVYQREGVY